MGKTLDLREDAWRSAPPNTINNGTACVQNAVPQSVYDSIVGGSPTASASITPPAQTASQVTVTSHAQDWTVTADGTDQAPNKGVVSITKGTAVHFLNNTGVHTLTVNSDDNAANWDQPNQSKDITFNDTGQFKIPCVIHPQMLATI